MSRVARQLLVVSVAALGGALLVDVPRLAAAVAVLVLAVGGWALWPRRGAPTEQPWSGAASGARSIARPAPPPRRLLRVLGGIEARELLLSPWFGIGVGLCVVMVISFASSYDGHEAWWEVVQDLPFLAHPLVGMTVVAVHAAATRAERDGAAELFASCPASEARRWSPLAAAPIPVVALAVFFGGYLAVTDLTTGVAGSFGPAPIPTVISGLVLGAGGAALGVALGRFVKHPIAPLLAVVAIAFASPALMAGRPDEIRTRSLLSTMPGISDQAPAMSPAQAWLHVAWLCVLTIATTAVAVTRRGATG
jgi:hypothetical protein